MFLLFSKRLGFKTLVRREICDQLVLRLHSKITEDDAQPGLDCDEFLTAAFVLSNIALSQGEFIKQYRTPAVRFQLALDMLARGEQFFK